MGHLHRLALCTGSLLLLVGAALGEETYTHPGENTDPSPGPDGDPPYEMAGRPEPRAPLYDPGDVAGWIVEGHDAEGWLYQTREQRVFQDTAAKLVYQARGANPWLLLRPAAPIPLPEQWDSIDLWTYGNNWGWAPDPAKPPLDIAALIEGADGTMHSIALGRTDYVYWFLMHGRRHEEIAAPARFVGLRLGNARNTEPLTAYLGHCSVYQEALEPLTFEPWPETLPFPTTPDTILPASSAPGSTNSASREGDATRFDYTGPDSALAYRYVPSTGTLADIEILRDGRAIRPCEGGGVTLATPQGVRPPDDPSITRTLVRQELAGDTLIAVWSLTSGEVSTQLTYRIRVHGKSLVVAMEANAPVVERVALGRTTGLSRAKLVKIPYLTYGGNDPRVLVADGLFLFEQFDWFVSNAARLTGAVEQGEGWARHNGDALYIPRTDGQRNLLRERLVITASPEFAEVLPTIPNPASPMREMMGDRLWRVESGFEREPLVASAKHWRARGCDRVAIRYHEECWRDGGESFTFRSVSGPARGGDPPLRDLVKRVRDLGWLVGLYTNYTDFAPVNSYWDPDHVTRTPGGDWLPAWMRCYAPKPMWSVEMQAKLAPEIDRKFDPDHSYCDVHTAVTPFERVDFDARVPGAGTFRQTFLCFGRLLYNEKIAYGGPVYSEGNNHWWYAGLTDGNYAQLISSAPPQEPLLVDFDLLKMHPLEMDAGMGAPGMFFRSAPADIDQFIGTTLAYGHIGYFDWGQGAGTLKLYYMHQPLQRHYVMEPVSRIEYDVAGQLLPTSEALASETPRRNRVHVAYGNGTEVWVNGEAETWDTGAEGVPPLPAWGYLLRWPGARFGGGSVLLPRTGEATDGPLQRVDASLGDEGPYYLDSRGPYMRVAGLGCEGAGALKREGDAWWLVPAESFQDFAFDAALLGVDPTTLSAVGVDDDGNRVGVPELRLSRGMLHVLPRGEQVTRYELHRTEGVGLPPLPEAPWVAPIGTGIAITLPAGVEVTSARWEWADQTRDAVAEADGRPLPVTVPADLPESTHAWLRLETGANGTLWLDFLAMPALPARIDSPATTTLREGEPLACDLVLGSELDEPCLLALSPGESEGVVLDGLPRGTTLAAHGSERIPLRVTLPWAEGAYTASVRATPTGPVPPEVVASASFEARLDRLTLVDLLETPLERGHQRRGEAEQSGFADPTDGVAEVTTGSSGGESRRCLFMHPSYGRKPGASYVAYSLDLPAEENAELQFAMGMRDGLDATDGVTFIVQVETADGTRTGLFRQHHKELRWEPVVVDLSAYAGQHIILRLVSDCGPADDTTADHSFWGEPRIRSTAPALVVRRAR